MILLKFILPLWVVVHCSGSIWNNGSVVFVIVNQVEPPHLQAAQDLASHLASQAQQFQMPCKIHIASNEWPELSAWTYFPLMERLSSSHGGNNSSWVVLVGERVRVRLPALLHILHTHDPTQLVFLGRGVSDHEETIIHHYASVDPANPILYPDARVGMVLSAPLINKLAKQWSDSAGLPRSEFTIDAAYEFSSYVKSAGVRLTHHPAFCVTDGPGCAVIYTGLPHCNNKVRTEDIHFAVKSCSRFHSERLPVIYDTWLGDAKNHAIYSDVQDASYGTVSLGVANTERGHCGKTLAIIRHVAQLPGVQWLAVVDDDTLISVQRLGELLSCYNPLKPVALGERYGFAATSLRGYDYLTGGAGMVFSKALVDRLASPGVCECPSDDTPDDMFLGICLERIAIPVIHSPTFHQARPKDYPEALLEGEAPVSFHKYWMIDPREAYDRYLRTTSENPTPVVKSEPFINSHQVLIDHPTEDHSTADDRDEL